MLIDSKGEDMQERYFVKKINDTEYQVYDTFEKRFIGEPSSNFEKITVDCQNLNNGWKKLREGHGF